MQPIVSLFPTGRAWRRGASLAVSLMCLGLVAAPAQNAAASTNAPATATVTRGSLKPKVQFDAVVEAVDMAPVKLEPKAWSDLTVLEAVPHGTRVKKGDTLVKLDLDKLREQIEETEQDRPGARLAFEIAVSELKNAEQTTPYKLEAARRSRRVADEDLAYFEKTGRAQREKSARLNVRSAEQRLEGAQEELRQLKKMYEADELTEETEEIVLKRQKSAVEMAEYGLELSRQQSELTLGTSIPREAETLKNALRDQEAALALAEETLDRTLARKRLDQEKLKRDQRKADKRFKDLKADLEQLTVVAPIDGIVYYGACEAGKWTTGPVVARKLVPTGKLIANEVFMTVVNPERLQLRATVTEADLANLKNGQSGVAVPVSAPDRRLKTRLGDLGLVPLPGGGYEARLALEKEKGLNLMPGMNCKVTLGEGQPTVLLVPREAVFTEGGDRVVYVAGPAGNARRVVKVGDSDNRSTEITAGVAEGDRVLLTRP